MMSERTVGFFAMDTSDPLGLLLIKERERNIQLSEREFALRKAIQKAILDLKQAQRFPDIRKELEGVLNG